MGRALLAIIAGEAVWTALWLSGTTLGQKLFPEHLVPGVPLDHVGLGVTLIALSVVASVIAGWLTARVKGSDPMGTVWVFAFIQLAIGLAVEVSSWGMAPAWYHLVFLALLIPATVWGGGRAAPRSSPR